MTQGQTQQVEEASAREAAEDNAPKKQWAKAPNPFGAESKLLEDGSRIHLLKNDQGAWIVRFDKKPNEMEGYSKENPHPVIAFLKSEGYRWGFDQDEVGGWGKQGADLLDARRVFNKAAEMVGAKSHAERTPF